MKYSKAWDSLQGSEYATSPLWFRLALSPFQAILGVLHYELLLSLNPLLFG